jgi:DNA repair protein RadC
LIRFGTLGSALSATREAREAVLSDWPAAARQLEIIGQTIRYLLSAEVRTSTLLTNPSLVADYLSGHIAHSMTEQVIALHLNSVGYLIRDEVVSMGSLSRAPVYPREIIRRALELGAATIIIAHNHPSGDPAPSKEDIQATRSLAAAAKLFDIELFDHFIITRSGSTSLRSEGLL